MAEKHIGEFEVVVETRGLLLTTIQEKYEERQSHLEFKKGELDSIVNETQKEEKLLLARSESLSESFIG